MTFRFGSVCSGIEAASVAFAPLGWQAAWLAEIEPFPSAVLAHHYPDVPNLGDMTTIADRIRAGLVEAPDMLCGGTPCQAFSVAGQRRSLSDERGNLSLVFCELADAIDDQRFFDGLEPCIVFWENVPGCLNTNDNAFGCILGELAGEDCALEPPGGKWADAGAVFGPKRAIAWRVLDAQYFGVAQRRRRVFLVASARKGFDPAAVLFEFHGVRRDSAPRREPGKVAPTIPSRSTAGGGLGTDFDLDGGVITMAHGQGGAEIGFDRGPTLTCNHEAPIAAYQATTQFGDTAGTGVRYANYSHDYAHDRITDPSGVNPALTKEAHASGNLNVAVQVAFPANLSGTQCASAENIAPSMGAKNPTAVAFNWNAQPAQLPGPDRDTIINDGLTCSQQGAVATAMQVRRLTPRECEALQGFPQDYTAIPWRKKPASECPDGPRYKALGNSWAVPVVRWIGVRINQHMKGKK